MPSLSLDIVPLRSLTQIDNCMIGISKYRCLGKMAFNWVCFFYKDTNFELSNMLCNLLGYELVILRNTNRLNFFEFGDNYIVGEVVHGLEQLEK